MARLAEAVSEAVRLEKGEIIAKRTSWRIERELNAQKRSPKSIREKDLTPIHIDVEAIFAEVSDYVESIIGERDRHDVLLRLPIKGTGLPNIAARSLGARSFDEYRTVVIRQLDIQSPPAMSLLHELRRRLPVLEPAELISGAVVH